MTVNYASARKVTTASIISLLTSLACNFNTSVAAKATIKPNGWTSYQTSSLLGDQDLYASAGGIKIIERRSGSGITACAPDWTVYADRKSVV